MNVDDYSTLRNFAAGFPGQGAEVYSSTLSFTPVGREIEVKGINPAEIPQTFADLGELISYTYDLSVTRAGELNIPVAGVVSGSSDGRVVILEWTRYKELMDAEKIRYRYGYVIRFCLTVNKWQAQAQVRLPFLAAQAEIGNIQASWSMQIRGLTGKKIDEVVLPPQELNVSTFIIAKQSLDKAISAVNDPDTKFMPGILLATIDPTVPDTLYYLGAVRAFALSYIRRGKSQVEALGKLGNAEPAAMEAVGEMYRYMNIADPNLKPEQPVREYAERILHGMKVDL